jgi:hypothetical protein
MKRLLLFHSNNGNANAHQYYLYRLFASHMYYQSAIMLHAAGVNVVSTTPTKKDGFAGADFHGIQKWLRERASLLRYAFISYFLYAKLHNIYEKMHRP